MPGSDAGSPSQDRAYFLQTDRLGFRRWTEADSELARGLWGDPEVAGLIGGPFSSEQVEERLRHEISTAESQGVQYWPIFLLSSGKHVGCCGLRPYKPEQRICEIGCHLRKAYWGQGYAAEATRAVIAHAFGTLHLAALFAGHNPANHASRRVLLALGFEYTHDEYYPPTGLYHPSYLLTAEAGATRAGSRPHAEELVFTRAAAKIPSHAKLPRRKERP